MFLYTTLVQRTIEDMARTVRPLRHVDARRLAVVAGPRACRTRDGGLAQCYGLRQPEEDDFTYWYEPRTRRVVRVTPWGRHENTRVTLRGVEMLYLVLLRLPRLLDHDPIATIVHELIHISPDFDGRLREMRHGRRFDAVVSECVSLWKRAGDPCLVASLSMSLEALRARWGSLAAHSFGPPFVSPRLCPVKDPPPFDAHPDFRRKRLVSAPDALEVVAGKWTPANVPSRLTEKDLVYRVYTRQSARRISAAAVRHAKSLDSRCRTPMG
jgi:predicted metallopeptidase